MRSTTGRTGLGGKESGSGMCRGALTATVASGLIALVTAGNALAATPQQIYRDLAENGRLDRKYSQADINRAGFGNASIPGYTRPKRIVRTPQARPAATPSLPSHEGRTLPFTGLDLALLAAVGGPLLLVGARMRRFARVRATEAS